MKKPLVSVVMPALNAAKYIREAVHSMIDQSYKHLELLIIDGGSTDRTCEIVEKYTGDGDIRLLHSKPHAGIATQMNIGLDNAKGEFIARMDADDVAMESRFDEQVKYLVANPEVDLVGTDVEYFGSVWGRTQAAAKHDQIRDMYLSNNPIFHPTVMFRRELYDRGIYRYDESFRAEEDFELWGKVIPNAVCANLNRSLLRYRVHGSNAQRDPWKYRFKRIGLSRFCKAYGIDNEPLIDALTEFQCSAFITPDMYRVMKDYADTVTTKPKIGWLQIPLTQSRSYGDFIDWYWRAKNWQF